MHIAGVNLTLAVSVVDPGCSSPPHGNFFQKKFHVEAPLTKPSRRRQKMKTKMEWDVFLDAHYRSHLVEMQLAGVGSHAAMPILEGCLEGILGSYALQQREDAILVAFERDVDAERFLSLVKADPGPGSAEWSSRSRAHLDGVARRKIVRALRRIRVKRGSSDGL
jgi:hypothetical protein